MTISKNFFTSMLLTLSLPALSATGSLSVKVNVPAGVIINSVHAHYGSGGLDGCMRSRDIQGKFTVKNGILTGSVPIKSYVRGESDWCIHNIQGVGIGFDTFQESGDFLSFDGAFLYRSPLIIPSSDYLFNVRLKVVKDAQAANVKNVVVNCQRSFEGNYVTARCDHDDLPVAGLTAKNSLEISVIHTAPVDDVPFSLVEKYSHPEIGMEIEVGKNKNGVLGPESHVRVIQVPGPVTSPVPVGEFIIKDVYVDHGTLRSFEFHTVNRKTNVVKHVSFDVDGNGKPLKECADSTNCHWDLQLIDHDPKGKETIRRFKYLN